MKKHYIFFLSIFLFAQAAKAQQVFTDDYGTGVTFAAFGGSTNAVTVDDAEKHTGTYSLKVAVPASGYTGGAFVSAAPLNLTTYNAVTFWVKASKNVTLNVSGLGNNATANSPYAAEYANVAVTTTWTKIIVPIPDASKLTASDGLFHFAEGSDEGAYSLWFDDIMYENLTGGVIGTPTAAIATETIIKTVGSTFTVNGTSAVFPVNGVNQNMTVSRSYFSYASTDATVASINGSGEGTAIKVGSADITAMLGTVAAAGKLTVNVTAASDPTTAAPTPPTRNTGDVISLFSNAYTNVPVDTWSASWDQADVADVSIAGNATKKYTNLNYAGVEAVNPTVDATNMTYFHMDIWTPNSTQFRIKLVDFGANGGYAGGDDKEHELTFTPTLGQWVSYDIPLTDFTNLTTKAHLAQFIFSGSASTVYVDNVYFYRPAAFPVTLVNFDAVEKAGKVQLQWNTASEVNNKGFFVQHSSDGNTWSNLSFVQGNGTSGVARTYTASDANPTAGINYYRLQQLDFDGHATYSAIKVVNRGNANSFKVALFPNPTSDKVTISATGMDAKRTRFEIADAEGRVVRTGLFANTNGDTIQTSVQVSDLTKGVYSVKLFDGVSVRNSKFVRN